MRILLMAVGFALALSSGAQAHKTAVVSIHEADKVVVKTGISQKKVMGMIHCLNSLKKHDTAEKAMGAAMAKMKKYCTMMNMDEEKCMKKQKRVARYIYNCYAKAEFLREYIKPAAAGGGET